MSSSRSWSCIIDDLEVSNVLGIVMNGGEYGGECTRYIEAKWIWHDTPIWWRHCCCCCPAHWIYGWYRRSSCSFNLSKLFCNMSTCCRNSVISLQTAVSGMTGTLLISARLVLYVFTGLEHLLGTFGTLLRARGGEDVAWRSSTSSLPEPRQSSSTSCTFSSSVSSSDKAVVASEPWDSQTLFPYCVF